MLPIKILKDLNLELNLVALVIPLVILLYFIIKRVLSDTGSN